MKVAFTLDDLPLWPMSYPPEPYTAAGIVDSIIGALDRHGITGVYAFANSWALDKHPEHAAIMDRWTDAGHHVGNHTHSHVELNDVGADDFVADVDRADRKLAPWSRHAPARCFRHPLCYWGNTEEKRVRVRAHLRECGYQVADVTSWLFEWRWNRAYRTCLERGDPDGIAFVKRSFLEFAEAQLRYDAGCARDWFGRDIVGITLGHTIPFFADILDPLLRRLIDAGIVFVPLEDALADPAYGAVGSVVSDKFVVYQQKLADAAGAPMAAVIPAFRETFDQIGAIAGNRTD